VPIDFTFSDMAARSDIGPARWRKPFLSWLNGIEEGWAVPLLLIGFVAAWTAYLVIAYVGGDLHADVLETWTLGRAFDWGSLKHPPLMGWVARVWTSVFPLTNWSFQWMALINAAIGLWGVDLICRRFVKGDKRVIVLLLLMVTPIYQLHAQRFNANAVLLAVWPVATYCFLRSYETRQTGWAVACGAIAALAMLGKYYSVFLIGGFILAAICHPQRRAYFTSRAPWISTIAGLAALGPHLHWLWTTGAKPFAYALNEHAGRSIGSTLLEALIFFLGLAVMLLLPAVIWTLMAGKRLNRFFSDFRTMNPGLLLLFFVSVGTVVLPVVTSIALGSDMQPIWALQGLFLFPVLIVCATSYPIERFYTVNLLVIAIGMAAVAVAVAAPIHAIYRNIHPLNEARNFYRPASMEVTGQWRQRSDIPLPVVGGDEGLALALAFYSPDHPYFDMSLVCPKPEEPAPASLDRGWAALCLEEDLLCVDKMQRIAPPASRVVSWRFTVQSSLLGWPGASQRFSAFIMPPRTEGAPLSPMAGLGDDTLANRCKRKRLL
jgi:4-amino-4-deoxy-L-arabinose transferase-like glycosyltransferase